MEEQESVFEVKNSEIASEIFTNYYKEKISEVPQKKKYKLDNYRKLYERLSKRNKFIVQNAVRDLLDEKDVNNLFGKYFLAVLRDENLEREGKKLTLYQMADLIEIKFQCPKDKKRYKKSGDDSIIGKEKIKSALEGVAKTNRNNGKELGNLILEDVAFLLNVNQEIFEDGQGTHYSFNEKRIQELLAEKGLDQKEFIGKILSKTIPCAKCQLDCPNINRRKMERFYANDVYSLADTIAKMWNIDIFEILNEEEYYLVLDEFPLDDYFKKLDAKGKKMIVHLIRNLHLEEKIYNMEGDKEYE